MQEKKSLFAKVFGIIGYTSQIQGNKNNGFQMTYKLRQILGGIASFYMVKFGRYYFYAHYYKGTFKNKSLNYMNHVDKFAFGENAPNTGFHFICKIQ